MVALRSGVSNCKSTPSQLLGQMRRALGKNKTIENITEQISDSGMEGTCQK